MTAGQRGIIGAFALLYVAVLLASCARPRVASPAAEALPVAEAPAEPLPPTILSAGFAYDSAEILPAAVGVLELAAGFYLESASPVSVVGHADERGTEAYNVALGQRRAEAAAAFLRAKGVQVDLVMSMGEAAPVCSEPREPCWAKNRRVDVLFPESL